MNRCTYNEVERSTTPEFEPAQHRQSISRYAGATRTIKIVDTIVGHVCLETI